MTYGITLSFIESGFAWIAFGVTLILPGLAWLVWKKASQNDPLETLAEAAGLSLSLTGLVGLLGFLTGAHFSSFGLGALYGTALLLGIWGLMRARVKIHTGTALAWLAAIVFSVVLIVWRLYQARSLALPAWVDSVHHTLIVRKILEYGGVPPNLQPYMDVQFFYYYGFHLAAALFAALSGLPPERAVLIFGQALNALVALSVYRLGKSLWKDARRAGLAALLVGFASHMPAYYLTWGRYTLLAGLVVLPLAMAAALDVKKDRQDREAKVRLAVLTAGVFLAHYLAGLLLGLFIAVVLLLDGLPLLLVKKQPPDPETPVDVLRKQKKDSWWALFEMGAAALAGVLLAFPWLWRVWEFNRKDFTLRQVSDGILQTGVSTEYVNYLLYLLGPKLSHFLLGLAGLGLLLALRRKETRSLALWGGLMALLTVPWTLRLGPFRPDHLAIILFLPMVLLVADLLCSGAEALSRFWSPWAGRLTLAAAAVGFVAWGVTVTGNILNPVTILTGPEDVAALKWVEQNTPPEARFFINAAFWQDDFYRGNDGGYWLMPLTGRESLIPPAMYTWGSAEMIAQVKDWGERAVQIKTCSTEFWSLVRDANLSFAYLHDGKGSLQPAGLENCAGVNLLYQQGGVSIYELIP